MPARYLDLHVLQDIPVSCLNRGDHNLPKTMTIGGTPRSVLSSQCLKRACRTALEADLGEPAARTRLLPLRLAEALRTAGWPADLAAFAGAQIARCATAQGLPTDPEHALRTRTTLYLPTTDLLDRLTALCTAHRPALERGLATAQQEAPVGTEADKGSTADRCLPTEAIVDLVTARTATINLFGRFLAELRAADVPGAVQMAWAFTTHTADLQPDFFTSVEDWARPGEPGGTYLSSTFLTAGVFYRYSSVNLTELTHTLGGDREQAIELALLYVGTFLTALPKAKTNSTAPHTLPDLAHYVVRDRRPVSYAAAFHRSVRADPHGGGHLSPSRRALAEHAAALDRLLGTRHRIAHGYCAGSTDTLDPLGTRHDSYDDLLAALARAAAEPSAPLPPARLNPSPAKASR
ncbi:type I-E CRISPR-associated protein Cas7/Cse4/CasC [Streptomyces sp. NPDC004111]|uniref:type I-E CRISPR-associated protein Cas7/Cse4/CasC n=1 Tax=Streptomyces sp. NPDC004111 TaxID=3364690 RepID=UPI00369DF53A